MTLSKNAGYRLRKSHAHLERAMDQLHQIQGLLYPPEVAAYSKQASAIILACQTLSQAIDKAIGKPATKPAPAAGKAAEGGDDPFLEEAAE